MDEVLSLKEQEILVSFLIDSGRLLLPDGRTALLIQIGLDPSQYTIHEGSARDFAIALVNRLSKSGNKEALRKLLQITRPSTKSLVTETELARVSASLAMTDVSGSPELMLSVVYVSYAEPDKEVAQLVEQRLTQTGYMVLGGTGSSLLGSRVELGLQSADCLVLVLSRSSMPYHRKVYDEWSYFDQERKPIFPLYVEACELHSRMLSYSYIDARHDLASSLDLLERRLSEPYSPPPDRIHPRDRIVISEAATDKDLGEALESVLSAVRDEQGAAVLKPALVKRLLKHRPKNLTEYRLSRIVQWSQQRYQLASRFVRLTLLVDQGEHTLAARWQEIRRFDDLMAVLSEVPDSALVLLGAPGSGKSTLLRRLELDYAIDGLKHDSPTITFYVELNQYRASSERGSTLPKQWLTQQWQDRFPDLEPFEELFAQGRILLLLDALNEIPHRNMSEYLDLVNLWRHFLQESVRDTVGNRFIFSCRHLDYSAPLSGPNLRVPQIRIELMSPSQMHEFLSVYVPARVEMLWQSLSSSSQFGIYRNPYFLKLLVEQIEESEKIPGGTAALFTNFVRRSLQREVENRNPLFLPNDLLTSRDWVRLTNRAWQTLYDLPERGLLVPKLSELALRMQLEYLQGEGTQVRIEYDEAQSLINDARYEDILRAGVALGVLEEDATREEISFFHQLLQEYFAAREFAKTPQPELVRETWKAGHVRPTLREVLSQISDNDPLPMLPSRGWEETALIAAALSQRQEAFVNKLAQVNLPLAGKCAVRSDVHISPATKKGIQQKLLKRMQSKKADLRARITAGLTLGELGDPRLDYYEGVDGVQYCLPRFVTIPSGEYLIGSEDFPSESPPHKVSLNRYSAAQFPVTNKEYSLFLYSGAYEDERWWVGAAAKAWRTGLQTAEGPKQQWRQGKSILEGILVKHRSAKELESLSQELMTGIAPRPPLPPSPNSILLEGDDPVLSLVDVGRITPKQADYWEAIARMSDERFEDLLTIWHPDARLTEPEYWQDALFNNPSQPVVGVSWHEARAYCAWLTYHNGTQIRLLTEAEWEAAARGNQARRYAYGDEFDQEKTNSFESHVRRTLPIGFYKDNVSSAGCFDMCGNVWEWTSSSFRPYPYVATDGREDANAQKEHRVLRGGSWNDVFSYSRAACRFHYDPSTRYALYSFRLGQSET